MTRIEFVLSMPHANSWNGRWSGEGEHYAIVRAVKDATAERLLAGKEEASWRHAWSDGWCACVTGRRMKPGERKRKSRGFSGYDWMVNNIIAHGSTCAPGEEPA